MNFVYTQPLLENSDSSSMLIILDILPFSGT